MTKKKSKLGSDIDPMAMFEQMIDKKIPDLSKTEKAKLKAMKVGKFVRDLGFHPKKPKSQRNKKTGGLIKKSTGGSIGNKFVASLYKGN